MDTSPVAVWGDDTCSILTWTTATSSSTMPGIGMVTGKFIKALGEFTIDIMENIVIRRRRRLAGIKTTIHSKPASFWDENNQEAKDMLDDLQEFLQ